MDYEPQTAMLLTEQEWADLAVIAEDYKRNTASATQGFWAETSPEWYEITTRRRALADRIIAAA